METFSLDGRDYIELNKLLKLLNIAESGGMANMLISEGMIFVNSEKEYRKRKKVRKGDIVEIEENRIQIID